ncbi:UPF0743 protein [Yarrowia sp. C11]|nr:UPF0743 protein [Yarrowia sp. E02]KAG5369636.1 UPF0743 protein [Yarrowia sp. C11]
MVSFSCEVCNDTIVKKKLSTHQSQCRGAYFTCIDCSTTFFNNDHVKHTSCISEAEKYEGALYRGKKTQQGKQAQQQVPKPVTSKPVEEPKKEEKHAKVEKTKDQKDKKNKNKKDSNSSGSSLDISKPTSMYKIVKDLKKNKNISEKEILKSFKIEKNDKGELVLVADI